MTIRRTIAITSSFWMAHKAYRGKERVAIEWKGGSIKESGLLLRNQAVKLVILLP